MTRTPPGCWNTRTTPARPSSAAGACRPVLLSGNHAEIARWRREQSLLRTLRQRPDLLEKAELSEKDRKFLEKVARRGIPKSTGWIRPKKIQ